MGNFKGLATTAQTVTITSTAGASQFTVRLQVENREAAETRTESRTGGRKRKRELIGSTSSAAQALNSTETSGGRKLSLLGLRNKRCRRFGDPATSSTTRTPSTGTTVRDRLVASALRAQTCSWPRLPSFTATLQSTPRMGREPVDTTTTVTGTSPVSLASAGQEVSEPEPDQRSGRQRREQAMLQSTYDIPDMIRNFVDRSSELQNCTSITFDFITLLETPRDPLQELLEDSRAAIGKNYGLFEEMKHLKATAGSNSVSSSRDESPTTTSTATSSLETPRISLRELSEDWARATGINYGLLEETKRLTATTNGNSAQSALGRSATTTSTSTSTAMAGASPVSRTSTGQPDPRTGPNPDAQRKRLEELRRDPMYIFLGEIAKVIARSSELDQEMKRLIQTGRLPVSTTMTTRDQFMGFLKVVVRTMLEKNSGFRQEAQRLIQAAQKQSQAPATTSSSADSGTIAELPDRLDRLLKEVFRAIANEGSNQGAKSPTELKSGREQRDTMNEPANVSVKEKDEQPDDVPQSRD